MVVSGRYPRATEFDFCPEPAAKVPLLRSSGTPGMVQMFNEDTGRYEDIDIGSALVALANRLNVVV